MCIGFGELHRSTFRDRYVLYLLSTYGLATVPLFVITYAHEFSSLFSRYMTPLLAHGTHLFPQILCNAPNWIKLKTDWFNRDSLNNAEFLAYATLNVTDLGTPENYTTPLYKHGMQSDFLVYSLTTLDFVVNREVSQTIRKVWILNSVSCARRPVDSNPPPSVTAKI